MPSPFPGMDPYIEGQVWNEFHGKFIHQIQEMLAPILHPRYLVRVDEHVILEEPPSGGTRRIRPDVSVIEAFPPATRQEQGSVAVRAAPVAGLLPVPEEVRQPYVELRSAESGHVITVIELLSPSNKRARSGTRVQYLAKREAILDSDTHLMEIDLLRGGERMPMGYPLPQADFYVIVSRSQVRPRVDVWPLTLREALPQVKLPLRAQEVEIDMDLGATFQTVYDRAGYGYTLQRDGEIVPPMNEEDAAWVRAVLASATPDGTQT